MKIYVLGLVLLVSISSYALDQNRWDEFDIVTCAESLNVIRASQEAALTLLKARDKYDTLVSYGLNDLTPIGGKVETNSEVKTTTISFEGSYYVVGIPYLSKLKIDISVDHSCVVRGIKVEEDFILSGKVF